MSRQDVVLKIGCAETVLRVKRNSSVFDEEFGNEFAEEIRKEITPEMITWLMTKSAAMDMPEQPRFDPESILKDVTVPFKIVTSPSFLCELEDQDVPCTCRSHEYNSIAEFNAKLGSQCIALLSVQKIDEAENMRKFSITNIEEMKEVLGHGPRILYAFRYAILTGELYQNIKSEFLVDAEK